jgi:hypothetical protein
MHLRAHSIGDLRQVNRCIVLVTNLTLHNIYYNNKRVSHNMYQDENTGIRQK